MKRLGAYREHELRAGRMRTPLSCKIVPEVFSAFLVGKSDLPNTFG